MLKTKHISKRMLSFNTEVYEQIMRFLKYHSRKSLNTSLSYEKDIRRFFLKTRQKEIEHLVKEDLIFTIEEYEDYYSYLIDELKISASSANRYTVSVDECFKHLKRRNLVENTDFLNIKRHQAVANSYGILTINEVNKMSELVLNHGKRKIGLIKKMLILFAVDTCARKSECLKLKWSNLIENENDVGIKLIAKGNKEFKPSISKEFYKQLLEIKQEDSEYVFNIHSNTVDRMIKKLKEEMNINEGRNITFHSFKKTGVHYIWKKTGDINQASKAANHSSIKTTEIYIDKEENYGVMGYFSDKDGVDEELFAKVSHDELVNTIRKLGKDQQMYINLKLNDVVNNCEIETNKV